MKLYTDYPIIPLGDKAGEISPIREVRLIAYDQDKYGYFEIEGVDHPYSFKLGYCYLRPIRSGEQTDDEWDKLKEYADTLPTPWDLKIGAWEEE